MFTCVGVRERERERKGRIVMTPKSIVIFGDDIVERNIAFNDIKKEEISHKTALKEPPTNLFKFPFR